MKSFFAALILLMTMSQTFAAEIVGAVAITATVGATATGVVISLQGLNHICKEAKQTVDDGNAFLASGILTVSLQGKIQEKMDEMESISFEEAFDLVLDDAEKILEENAL